ncbi:hypothetical protein HBH56_216060 [Parastagonospora nodorum]|uniref:Uncharacterized protein n=1 Tax=Phaeosphaeria nodorum (strain SN15 / ATCC MYA-4574 / FGSC 10173) TaxID=321614 RepID=A0A7U2EVY6_PHANO|nr:hypothetical protein HBH56_216060 [Parastagonospora nodorum]QRC93902.1 hypothetical protein JI435_155980 [Parastagonospora nodorum SN15]KAH3922610.1 hypothetical protein HBH54_221450 [Parastagonospora nodorum]KAH4126553.1 hypothetical protein HBH45_221500 [Parastagonospora nodorum]KAH4148642.1 hypothetical protein HBH44_206010 [Parastagonospora nodorum]
MGSPFHYAKAKRMRSDSPEDVENKRPRLDGSTDHDENNVPDMSMLNDQGMERMEWKAKYSLDLFADFIQLSKFLAAGEKKRVPAISKKHRQINHKWSEINQVFKKFLIDLSEKYGELEGLMGKAVDVVGKHERWWELTNIFAPGIDCGVLRPLQERSVPTTVDYADYIRENMYIIWDPTVPFSDWEMDWFFEFLDEEVHRVFDMSREADTWIASAQLTITAKTDILQSPTQTTILDSTLLHHHAQYDCYLRQMLTERFDKLRYVNAAKACREVRERMNRHECEAYEDEKCVFNILLPTLEILQGRAKYEVCHAVMLATGAILPAELADLVVEYTLLAEEVPSDPEIFVQAKHKVSGREKRKARLVCEHTQRRAVLTSNEELFEPWVWGPDWVEIEPDYLSGEDDSDLESKADMYASIQSP